MRQEETVAWRQEIHHSGWLRWDEEQIQSADSLVEPETFIIIITAPFTGLSAFLYGIIHHVISVTADYSSHQNGKKIQKRTAWALIPSFFFPLQLSITLVLLCGGTLGENKPSCILYLRFKFQCSNLQMWAAGHSKSSNCRPEAEGGGKRGKNCIELFPISCKHRMSSSHTEISDQKNSKKDWRKEGRKKSRNNERNKKKEENTIQLIKKIHSRVIQCHNLHLYLFTSPHILICVL